MNNLFFSMTCKLAVGCVTLALLSPTSHAAPGTKTVVLTNTESNATSETTKLLGSEMTPKCPTQWSVTRSILRGGKQEGVELVTIDNGAMQITIVPTRGMSVLQVQHGDTRLGWDSPIREIVHPRFINLESRNGLGWLEGFNEWMVRCGLEFAGSPGPDKFITNTGDEAEMNLTLHGKIGNIPASRVEVSVDQAPPYRIHVRGIVHERTFHGPKLTLETDISTTPGSDSLRISDSVTNISGSPQEMQLIYHTNYGQPILEAGAKIATPASWVAPISEYSAKAIGHFAEYDGPQAGFVEEVFCLKPLANADGLTQILLENAAADIGTTIRWNVEQLPYLTVWKNTISEEDGYVTGLEPATGFPLHRSIERQFGRVPKLAAGETRQFVLDFGLHLGREAVADQRRWIADLQGDQAIEVRDTLPTAKP